MKSSTIRRWWLLLSSASIAALMGGCAAGPTYQRPAALGTNAVPAAFAETSATNLGVWKSAEPAAHLSRGAWWELFGDPELNRLEALATANNQELAAALAHFEQARAQVDVTRADLLPQIATAPSYSRQRTSANSTAGKSSTYNSFSVPLSVSWELDLWGRVRRGVEGARARLAATADDLESAKLGIQAELAMDYFTLRAYEAQTALLQETIKTYQRSLQLTQNRHAGGIATDYDVSLAQTQLKSTEAQLPAVELLRANLRHAIATLCGLPPAALVIEEAKGVPAPPAIPPGVPSELLERRPDIAAAERRMAAANADVGVAVSAFYPRVFLSGLAGFQSIDVGTLFDWPSRVWAVGPSVQMPLFTGGRTRAGLASARASYDEAVAAYRQTVLGAFQEVEDHLAAQRLLAREHEAESAALAAARRTLEISNTRYKGGVITYLEVAIAQNAALSREQTVVQLAARRLSASVSLIKALGAGWTAGQAPEPVSASVAPPKQGGPSASRP